MKHGAAAPPKDRRTRRQQQIYDAVDRHRKGLSEVDRKAISNWHQFLFRSHLTYPQARKFLIEESDYDWVKTVSTRTARNEAAWKRLHNCQALLVSGKPSLARIEASALIQVLEPYLETDLDAQHVWVHCLEILRDTGEFGLAGLIAKLWRIVERRDPRPFMKSLIMQATIERKISYDYREALRILKGVESGLCPKRNKEGFIELYRETTGAIVRLVSSQHRELEITPTSVVAEYASDLNSLAVDIGTAEAKRESFHDQALLFMSCADYGGNHYLSLAENAVAQCLQQPIKSPYHQMSNLRTEIELAARLKRISGLEGKTEEFFRMWKMHPSIYDFRELCHLAEKYSFLRVPAQPPVTPEFPGVLLVRLYESPSMAVPRVEE